MWAALHKGRAEKLLLAAVLTRAVRDFVVYSRGRSPEEDAIAESARVWIFEESEGEWGHITSFHNICLAMDLDCERVRAQVKKMLTSTKPRGLTYGSWTA